MYFTYLVTRLASASNNQHMENMLTILSILICGAFGLTEALERENAIE